MNGLLKKLAQITLIIIMAAILPLGVYAAEQVHTFTYTGGSVTTPPSAPFKGGSGQLYPTVFDATNPAGLTVIFHRVNMSYSRAPLPFPLTGSCPTIWPAATSQAYFGGGVTNDKNLGPSNVPNSGAWVWLFNVNYYFFQTWYKNPFTGDDPSFGSDSPYQAIHQCGWNGPNADDPLYDTFDIKLVFTLQPNGDLRLTPYMRLHKTTQPFSNPPDVWIPFYSAGDCTTYGGCLDIPAETFNFKRINPFALISNGEPGGGNVNITWDSVEATGVVNERLSKKACKSGGWALYTSPLFMNKKACSQYFK